MTARARTIIIALSVVGICVLVVLGVLVGAAVAGYRAAMRAGDEVATIQNLKTIAAVEFQYFDSHKRTFGTLDQLINESELNPKFRHPVDGYLFTLTLAPKPDGSSRYEITADPQYYSAGRIHLYIDSDDHRIRMNPDRQASPTDPYFQEYR